MVSCSAMSHPMMVGAQWDKDPPAGDIQVMRGATPEGIEIAKTKNVYRGRARKLTLEQVPDARCPVPGARCRVEVGVPKAKSRETLAAFAARSTTPSPPKAPTHRPRPAAQRQRMVHTSVDQSAARCPPLLQ